VKVCGDGYHHPEEGCDDGNLVDGDGCSSECTVEDDWGCVDNEKGKSLCHKSSCGNGEIGSDEECDDGNNVAGDGCDSQCHVEPGYNCERSGTKSVCESSCGDGVKASDEECDDGNDVNGDGCSSDCTIEHGYNCTVNLTEPECALGACRSYCSAICGDGIVAQKEECDDGNPYQGDGCFNCKIESDEWICRGEPSICILRSCTLSAPDVTVTHVSCHGALTGVIDIHVNSADIVSKVWDTSKPQPSSYMATTHYPNLGAGNYRVIISVSGFDECSSSIDVQITEPPAFTNLKGTFGEQFGLPSSCETSDGWIKWSPSGGTKPYKFHFANRNVQEHGEYDNVAVREFLSGKPFFIDANNCTRELEVAKNWPDASWCPVESESQVKSSGTSSEEPASSSSESQVKPSGTSSEEPVTSSSESQVKPSGTSSEEPVSSSSESQVKPSGTSSEEPVASSSESRVEPSDPSSSPKTSVVDVSSSAGSGSVVLYVVIGVVVSTVSVMCEISDPN